ncbi:c-type cytochrome [Sulfurirhabdus autotrophica]|uniref:Cytochrome c oxidase cbb3-type subunit 3 n=1 Tax=Sulfurirhabdus autotrophica TaxID=1706046 RepID=A0A4R3XZB2_9PROT|nr:c-type cytochrome [Sulfurirhabdus autotrophica]TCV83033.1 cytochrome c oxidase cbb3-type subunit 3 [Sulfurirhabdus autotrophica]
MIKNIILILVMSLLDINTVLANPDGAKLFSQNCATCHGDNGAGGIGVPLALASFQSTISDDYVRKTIRHGRPGRIMPAFTQINDAEVEAIVKYVRAWNKTKPIAFSQELIKGDPVHGKQLFSKYCASCHGANGEGGKGTGVTFSRPRDLPIMAPALHNPGFLASATDAMIKNTLIMGRKGTPMISFYKHGLNEKDINDIVSHIRGFEKQPVSESATILETEQAILSVDSPYDLQTTIENVKNAATSHNFIFIREQTLDSGLVPEGTENPKQHIIYFCNFNVLNQALATDPRVGLFLPCRITAVEQNGKVRLYSVNPKRLSKIFNNSALNNMCDEMTKQYKTVMEEATF